MQVLSLSFGHVTWFIYYLWAGRDAYVLSWLGVYNFSERKTNDEVNIRTNDPMIERAIKQWQASEQTRTSWDFEEANLHPNNQPVKPPTSKYFNLNPTPDIKSLFIHEFQCLLRVNLPLGIFCSAQLHDVHIVCFGWLLSLQPNLLFVIFVSKTKIG